MSYTFLNKDDYGVQIKKDEIRGACGAYWGKHEKKSPLGMFRHM
jgi:hypothetical protein